MLNTESTKEVFIDQVNQKGVLLVRQRNPKDDLTGWGALEFVLNDETVFVISSIPFGQGDGEDGFWVDMNSWLLIKDSIFFLLRLAGVKLNFGLVVCRDSGVYRGIKSCHFLKSNSFCGNFFLTKLEIFSKNSSAVLSVSFASFIEHGISGS